MITKYDLSNQNILPERLKEEKCNQRDNYCDSLYTNTEQFHFHTLCFV